MTGPLCHDAEFLARVKTVYTDMLPEYPRFEIAESFFNSVYCRLFNHRELTPDKLFVFSSQPERHWREFPRPLARTFKPDAGWHALINDLLGELPLRLPWEDRARDVDYILSHLESTFGENTLNHSRLQVANELFYRNKAAWLVGKLHTPEGIYPFLLPIHHNEQGALFVDTCLTRLDEASIVLASLVRTSWCMHLCRPRWLTGCARFYRGKQPLSSIWRLAAKSMGKQNITASI